MIIQSTKAKVKNAENLVRDLDEFEVEIEKKEKRVIQLKTKVSQLEKTIEDINSRIESKENTIEVLNDRDARLNSEIDYEVAEFRRNKARWQEDIKSKEEALTRAEKKIILEKERLDGKEKALVDSLVEREKNCADREKDLDILSAHLEEYKIRLLVMGGKRGVPFNQ